MVMTMMSSAAVASSSDDEEGGGSCYIATATYGSPDADEVVALSNFRDSYLLTNAVGRAFVECYYAVAPTPANYIAERDGLRSITKAVLTPAVSVARSPIILIGLFLGLFALLGIRIARTRR